MRIRSIMLSAFMAGSRPSPPFKSGLSVLESRHLSDETPNFRRCSVGHGGHTREK